MYRPNQHASNGVSLFPNSYIIARGDRAAQSSRSFVTGKSKPDLSRDTFEFFGAHELIALHSDSHFIARLVAGGLIRLKTAQHLAKTTDADGWIAARKRDQIFDPVADFDILGRSKTYATGADVTRLFNAIHRLATQMNNLERQLKFVSLRTPLFQ